MLKQIDMINFTDVESRSPGFAIVRAGENEVGLTLSLDEDGDIEVFLNASECEHLVTALRQAVSTAKGVAAPV